MGKDCIPVIVTSILFHEVEDHVAVEVRALSNGSISLSNTNKLNKSPTLTTSGDIMDPPALAFKEVLDHGCRGLEIVSIHHWFQQRDGSVVADHI
jgi:hypothetical protein